MLHTRQDEGLWRHSQLDIDPARVARTTVSGGRTVLAVQTDAQVELGYLRTSLVARLGSLDRPPGPWGLFGLSDRVELIAFEGSDLVVRSIDPVTGAVSEPAPMTRQPAKTRSFVAIAFMWLLALGAMLLIFFFRPAVGDVEYPEGWEAAPPGLRLAGLAFDLVPAGALAMFMLSVPVSDLIYSPILTPDVAKTAPYLLACALTVAHGTLGELLTGRSLGKAVLGTRVVSADGLRAGLRQTLVRNVIKSLVLMLPPLAVFALLSPHQQGLGEQMSRTLVIRRRPMPIA